MAVANALLDALETAGIARSTPEARRRGYATVSWPGRLELLEVGGREVLLDGAHNPAGAAALADALDDLRPFLAPGPITLLTASMADKDVAGVVVRPGRLGRPPRCRPSCASQWMRRGRCRRPISPRSGARPTRRPRGSRSSTRSSPGFARALETADGPIVVAGSLYLVGAVRGRIVHDDVP